MESAREFMERYLREILERREKAISRNLIFREKYFGETYLARCREFNEEQRRHPETLESIEEDRLLAKAITSDFFVPGKSKRYRYHLSLTSGTWKIEQRDIECFLCQGKGRGIDPSCKYCEGKGWK